MTAAEQATTARREPYVIKAEKREERYARGWYVVGGVQKSPGEMVKRQACIGACELPVLLQGALEQTKRQRVVVCREPETVPHGPVKTLPGIQAFRGQQANPFHLCLVNLRLQS